MKGVADGDRLQGGVMEVRSDHRHVGAVGERLAAWYLQDHGLAIVDRNVRVGRGEIDLICRDGGERLAVEVRTRSARRDRGTVPTTPEATAIESLGDVKVARVKSLAVAVGLARVDLVAVDLRSEAVEFRWIRNAG